MTATAYIPRHSRPVWSCTYGARNARQEITGRRLLAQIARGASYAPSLRHNTRVIRILRRVA